MKFIPAILVSLVLGFVLGAIPVVNENLHWNLWLVLPISGLITGAIMGRAGFALCFMLGQRITRYGLICLALAAMAGYATVDYGTYVTASIGMSNVEGIPDGQYSLRELTTFAQYMRYRLGSTSIDTRYGRGRFELGRAGTTISYIIDLLGAGLGAAGILVLCRQAYPFCGRCSRFKIREKKYRIVLKGNDGDFQAVCSRISELVARGAYSDIVDYFEELSRSSPPDKGDIRITVDQRLCPQCREASLLGEVERRVGREWRQAQEARFSLTSSTGADSSAASPTAQTSPSASQTCPV